MAAMAGHYDIVRITLQKGKFKLFSLFNYLNRLFVLSLKKNLTPC